MAYYKITGENKEVFNDEHFNRNIRASSAKGQERLAGGFVPNMPYRFRCCDDDGVTYFWGVCSNDSSFAPLDWEGADYGCTYIEYKNPVTGEYEML